MCELRRYERQVFSQFGEDGIIAEILSRLGISGRCVEVGCSADFGNCFLWAQRGWPTLFIDVCRDALCQLMTRFNGPHVTFMLACVNAENVNAVVPADTLLLSIDIDGMDYWVWRALRVNPPVVVIEFNWVHPPPARLVVPYDATFAWDHTDYHGASLAAMAELGRSKGYLLVATDSGQGNAYFVRRDVAAGKFTEESPQALWSPAPWGSHPHSDRPWLDPAGRS